MMATEASQGNFTERSGSPMGVVPPDSDQADLEEASTITPTDAKVEPSEEKEGGLRAWGVVFGAFLANFISFGVANVDGVFLRAYLGDPSSKFNKEGSFKLSFVVGIGLGLAFVAGPFSNILTTRFGIRAPVALGVILITVAMELASISTKYWHLFLSQGVMWGLGASLIFIPSIGLPSQYFTKRRGLATGLASGGSAIGTLVLSPSLQKAIETVKIPWTFRILGFIELGLGILCVILLRPKPIDPKSSEKAVQFIAFDLSILKVRGFPLYLAYAFLQLFGYVTPVFWLPNYAHAIGLSASQGANVITIFGGVNFLGRLLAGFVGDRLGIMNVLASFTFMAGLLCVVCWLFARSYGVLIVFVVLWGIMTGAYWALTAPATAQIVGRQRLGSALSFNFLMNVIPPIFASAIGSGLVQGTANMLGVDQTTPDAYRYLIVWSGLVYMVSALILLAVRFMLGPKLFIKL
ncbi:MFS general substrate transporter [Acaromyces ingoldii]|uniref:MFS general substrate transporter n=1 Tax=Acaromyces ingoldii TaxID=215250 RepID=A0A316YRY3_9BASI|nr:MFS general substrate transporter [Acaromyces ingoldii]PWN92069.1 MFS general substrate transporter [Acaromyces ingoldii]